MTPPPIGASSDFTTARGAATATTRASEIDTWARRIAQWRRREDVYAYFNNDWRGFAPANAKLLLTRFRDG